MIEGLRFYGNPRDSDGDEAADIPQQPVPNDVTTPQEAPAPAEQPAATQTATASNTASTAVAQQPTLAKTGDEGMLAALAVAGSAIAAGTLLVARKRSRR